MAIDESLPIIAAGDLIDRQVNEQEPIEFLRMQMDRLQANKVPFYFVQGQHELQNRPWMYVHKWPDWLDYRKFEENPILALGCMPLGNRTVQGFDWHPSADMEKCMGIVSDTTDVLVMHQVSELMGSVRVPELSFAQIPHAKVLVIGDYHVHEEHVYKGRQGQDLLVLSPGSTCMQSIDEPPLKFIYKLYADLSFESVPLKTRLVRQPYPIIDEESLEAFVAEASQQLDDCWQEAHEMGLPEHLCKPILIVPYNPLVTDAYRRIKKAVGDKGHLFDDAQMPVTPEREERKAAREKITAQGLIGCLDLVCDPKVEPEVHAYVKSLLEHTDPQVVIREKRGEFELDVKRVIEDT